MSSLIRLYTLKIHPSACCHSLWALPNYPRIIMTWLCIMCWYLVGFGYMSKFQVYNFTSSVTNLYCQRPYPHLSIHDRNSNTLHSWEVFSFLKGVPRYIICFFLSILWWMRFDFLLTLYTRNFHTIQILHVNVTTIFLNFFFLKFRWLFQFWRESKLLSLAFKKAEPNRLDSFFFYHLELSLEIQGLAWEI